MRYKFESFKMVKQQKSVSHHSSLTVITNGRDSTKFTAARADIFPSFLYSTQPQATPKSPDRSNYKSQDVSSGRESGNSTMTIKGN